MIPRFKPWLGWPEFAALFRRNRGAVERFEQAFAQAFQAVDAVAFPYGRSAQWAFFKAMGVENAEIIMPAYTCSVVAHAVTLSGNTPRFIDIDLYDYNMNLDEAEAAITENTRAIIATHTFGYPQDLDRFEAMVRRAEARYGHKVWLMQDCCHAFGAEWQGRMIGTSGDVAVYAFNISKIMTSIFGGMLTFQDQALADKVRAWRDAHYHQARWIKALQRRLYLLAVYIAFNEKVYGLTWWLQEKTPLLNSLTKAYHLDDQIHFPPDYLNHMLDVEAAVGMAQLRKYPRIIQRRRDNALWYDQHLERREGWHFPPLVEGATYSHYVVRVPKREATLQKYASLGLHLGILIQYVIPTLKSYTKIKDTSQHAEKAASEVINFNVSSISDADKRMLGTVDCPNDYPLSDIIEAMARLHYDTLTENDFSKRLGIDSIKIFYQILLEGKYGMVFYKREENNRVIALCCVFHKFDEFSRVIKLKLLPFILKEIINRKLKASDLIIKLIAKSPETIRPFYNCHLGMIALDQGSGKNAVVAFREVYTLGLDYLRSNGCNKVWGSTLVSNKKTINFLKKSGFVFVQESSGINYYEKNL